MRLGGASIADAVFVIVFLSWLAHRKEEIPWANPVMRVFLVPLGVVIISLLGKTALAMPLSSDEIKNIAKMAALTLISLIGVSRAREEGVQALPLIRLMLTVLGISIVTIGLLGLFQYLRPENFQSVFGSLFTIEDRDQVTNLERAEMMQRISSVFPWANSLGIVLAMALVILVMNRRLLPKLVLPAAVIAGVPALFLTNSRVSLLLFAIGFIYILIFEGRRRLLMWTVVAAVLVMIMVPFESIVSRENMGRLEELADLVRYGELPGNVQVRLSTIDYLTSYIFATQYLYFGFPNQVYQNLVFIAWDNQYLGWLVRYGLVGIILVAWEIALIVLPYRLIHRKFLDDPWRTLVHSVLIVNIMMFVAGFSQDTVFLNRWREFCFFFMPLVLTIAVERLPERASAYASADAAQ